jgi:hypothetical protein
MDRVNRLRCLQSSHFRLNNQLMGILVGNTPISQATGNYANRGRMYSWRTR